MLSNPSRTGLVRRRGGKINCPKGISTQNRKEPYDVLNETEPLKRRTGIKKNALQRSICVYILKNFLKGERRSESICDPFTTASEINLCKLDR